MLARRDRPLVLGLGCCSPSTASPGLTFALPDAARLFRTVFESGNIDRGNGNFDEVVFALADHLAVGDVLLEVLFDPAPDDLSKPAMIFAEFDHLSYFLSFTSPRAKMLAT